MCIRYIYRHHLCQHIATGTARMHDYLWRRDRAFDDSLPCTGNDIQEEDDTVQRGYSDACIIQGLRLWKSQGLDLDIYADNMDVGLDALLLSNPGCLD